MTTITRQPVVKTGIAKTFAFLIKRDKTSAWILDNYIWAIDVKKFPIKDFNRLFRQIELFEGKQDACLHGFANYAVYAGMTPAAAEVLPLLIPMTKAEIAMATKKGEETLARHKTAAAAEKAADAKRPLTGAALKSKLAREAREAEAAGGETIAEPGTSNSAVEPGGTADDQPDPITTKVGKLRSAKGAQAARAMAAEVSSDLAEAEAAGENPAELVDPKAKKKKVDKPIKEVKTKPAKIEGDFRSASAMFKALILENKHTDDEIFAAVKTRFNLDDSKRSYVAWNRNFLKKAGQL